jgi:hypothetical protein
MQSLIVTVVVAIITDIRLPNDISIAFGITNDICTACAPKNERRAEITLYSSIT